jgi:hypothetical protein|tara:strand:+ start:276 stop:422 length:147 start_codon:yes stop_codon:yes gene_type:complete
MLRIQQISDLLNCSKAVAEEVLSKISHMDLSEMGQEEWEFWVNFYGKV